MKTFVINKEMPEDLELCGSFNFNDGGGVVYLFKSTIKNEWYEYAYKSKKWIKVKLVHEINFDENLQNFDRKI